MVLCLVIDALCTNYLNELKFLALKLNNQNQVLFYCKPSFGFEPDAAYLAGLFPDESASGAQFCYNPGSSPLKNLSYLPASLNNLPYLPDKIFRKLLTKYLKRKSNSPVFTLPNIPFEVAHNFDFTLDDKIDSDYLFGKNDTIFKLLKKHGKSYFLHSIPDFRVDSLSVLERVKSELTANVDFVFLMIGDLDKIGHKYGPSSSEIIDTVRKVDNVIEQIYNIIMDRFENLDLVLFGDHGMCDVKKLYNIETELLSTNLKLGRDYLYFIDSTMTRFWFFDQNAKKTIVEAIDKNSYGHFLTQEEIDKYHLNYNSNKMGELFFIADAGVLLFPNFYQKFKPVKGMHGYLPDVPCQQSLIIINSTKIDKSFNYESPVDMRRIYPTLLKLLDIDEYKSSKLEPLI